MNSTNTPAPVPPQPPRTGILRILLGLVLLVPACLACTGTLLIPTIGTWIDSFKNLNPLQQSSAFVGFNNYIHLFQDKAFWSSLGLTGLVALVRLLVVAFVPLFLALGIQRLGEGWKRLARLGLSIPLVLAAPVGVTLIWLASFNPNLGLFGSAHVFASTSRTWVYILLDSLYTFILALAVGLVFYLAALRGAPQARAGDRRRGPSALVVAWAAGLLVTLALSLQTFSMASLLQTPNLALREYQTAFMFFQFGPASAIASLVLVLLAGLGLVAGLLVVLSRVQIEWTPATQTPGLPEQSNSKSTWGRLLFILALVLAVPACLVSALVPLIQSSRWLSQAFTGSIPGLPSVGTLYLNTYLPPLIGIFFIQLPITYLGALAIGGFRPLGKRSEWLLLVFSPWLFTGIIPLALFFFLRLHDLSLYNSWLALFPLILVNIPALFLLTLFFKGQEEKWQALYIERKPSAGDFFKIVILPSLPLAILLGLVEWWIQTQALFWPTLALSNRSLYTLNVALAFLHAAQPISAGPTLRLMLTAGLPASLLFLILFCIFQLTVLARLAIRRSSK